MKKTLFLVLFGVIFGSFAAEKAPLTGIAVFSDNTVFKIRECKFAPNKKIVSFFEDEVFFKGSFALSDSDIGFGIKYLPRKKFIADVYYNPNVAFAGRDVVIALKNYGKEERIISGKIIKIDDPENPSALSSVIAVKDNASGRITYIKVADIARITADNADMMSNIEIGPYWTFTRKNTVGEQPFKFSYLTTGISWAGIVELHLISDDKLNILHNAEIRNNGDKFSCSDFYLVSGSPEIAMRNVISLLNSGNSSIHNVRYTSVSYRKTAVRAAEDSVVMNSAPAYSVMQTSDVLYRKIGALALDKKESCLKQIQKAENVPYCIAVKWDIPSARNIYGRAVSNNNRQTAYNTLIFKNQCPTMLDAAPVAIYSNGKLLMQSMLDDLTPVNQERSIRISEANGIDCRIEEQEIVSKRVQNVYFNNRKYVKCTIEAELKVRNMRKIASPVKISYDFNGEFISSSDASGKISRPADTAVQLNPSGRMKYDFSLPAGAEKKIRITYTVLTAF